MGYDAAGQLTSSVNSVGSLTVSADGSPSSPVVYDPDGRRAHVPREYGSQWVYGYNGRGEVTSGGKQQSCATALLGPERRWLARWHSGMTLGELGKSAGGGDYVTVGMALKRFELKLDGSIQLRRDAAKIERIMLNVDSAEKPPLFGAATTPDRAVSFC